MLRAKSTKCIAIDGKENGKETLARKVHCSDQFDQEK
jgi:hypothetical protein